MDRSGTKPRVGGAGCPPLPVKAAAMAKGATVGDGWLMAQTYYDKWRAADADYDKLRTKLVETRDDFIEQFKVQVREWRAREAALQRERDEARSALAALMAPKNPGALAGPAPPRSPPPCTPTPPRSPQSDSPAGGGLVTPRALQGSPRAQSECPTATAAGIGQDSTCGGHEAATGDEGRTMARKRRGSREGGSTKSDEDAAGDDEHEADKMGSIDIDQRVEVEGSEAAARRAITEDRWGAYSEIHALHEAWLALPRQEAHGRHVIRTIEQLERVPIDAAGAAQLVPAAAWQRRAAVAAVGAALTVIGSSEGLSVAEYRLLAEAAALREQLRRSQGAVRDLQTRLQGQHPQGCRALLAMEEVAARVGRCAPAEWALVARRGAQAAREAKLWQHRGWAQLAGGLYVMQATPGMLGHPQPALPVEAGTLHCVKVELRKIREEVAEWDSDRRFTPFAAWLERVDTLLELYEMRRLGVGLLAREAALNSRRAYTAYRALEPPAVAAALGSVTEEPEWLPPLLQTGQPQGPAQQQQLPLAQQLQPPVPPVQQRRRRRRLGLRRLLLLGLVLAAVAALYRVTASRRGPLALLRNGLAHALRGGAAARWLPPLLQ